MMEGTSEGEMAAGSRAREGAVERTVLAARTGTRGENAGLSLSMRRRDGARARGDRGLRMAALRGSEGRKRGCEGEDGDRALWACVVAALAGNEGRDGVRGGWARVRGGWALGRLR